jgi:hypothetical protein
MMPPTTAHLLECKEGALCDRRGKRALLQRQVDAVHLIRVSPVLLGVFF